MTYMVLCMLCSVFINALCAVSNLVHDLSDAV